MTERMRATAWGVRGSFPRAAARFLEYGGNTACFSLEWKGGWTIFDAGSGLSVLGEELCRRDVKEASLLLSHPHLDHLLGLLAFAPLGDPSFTLHLYGEKPLQAMLEKLIGPPFWPIKLTGYPADIDFHEIEPGGTFPLPGGLSVRTLRGNHPGGSLCYRVEGDSRSVIYTLDCELSKETSAALTRFARGGDLLIWDASFAPGRLKPGWGHSTWEQGAALAWEAEVKRVWMAHYAPEYDDGFLRGQEALAREAGIPCAFAREGMVIEL